MTHIWYHPPIILRQNDKGWAGRVVSLLEYCAGEGGKWLLNPPPPCTLLDDISSAWGFRMVTPGYKFLSGVVGWGGKVILVEIQTVVWRLSPLNIFFSHYFWWSWLFYTMFYSITQMPLSTIFCEDTVWFGLHPAGIEPRNIQCASLPKGQRLGQEIKTQESSIV